MPGKIRIETVPLPEDRLDEILELLELLGLVVKPVKEVSEFKKAWSTFHPKLCRYLEASMRSDIACLCKYIDGDFCKEPKIKECLTRLWKSYSLYQKLCC